MRIKSILTIFLALIIAPLPCGADFQEEVRQVSKITGVAPNRIAKMAEAMDKINSAVRYAHEKKLSKQFSC